MNHPLRGMAVTTAILSHLSGATIVGIFLGRWLDGYFQTSPLFLIIGIFMGLAAGVYGTIALVKKFLGDDAS
ncbi:AtpZ/AtpI family protein [Alkalibacillus aidingensis]|uniref:AtpZ/AtpI family protein n=1 Tax=Alkalibacillus aidingensis TaxID=2747607 RepID=UPI00166139C1|nr:AtpZ/AtpI family protein [Alkalibacillus aidingensis]